MAGFTVTKQMNAPVDEVFRVCSNFPEADKTVPDIKKIEMVTEGPVGAGTRFRETRVMFGKEATEEFEVTAFEPDKKFTMVCESCGCRYEVEHRFIPDGDGTRVELATNYKALTFMAKLMTPMSWMMVGIMKKCIDKDLEAVKAKVEGATAEA